MDDAGQYQCLAENEMGAVEKVVILVLQSESRPPPNLGGDSVRWALGGGSGCAEAGPVHARLPGQHGGQRGRARAWEFSDKYVSRAHNRGPMKWLPSYRTGSRVGANEDPGAQQPGLGGRPIYSNSQPSTRP